MLLIFCLPVVQKSLDPIVFPLLSSMWCLYINIAQAPSMDPGFKGDSIAENKLTWLEILSWNALWALEVGRVFYLHVSVYTTCVPMP